MQARTWRSLALAALALAAASVAWGVATGRMGVTLIVILPVFYGTGPFALVPVAFVVAAFIAWGAAAAATAREAREAADGSSGSQRPMPDAFGHDAPDRPDHDRMADQHERGRFGGVVLIGPIPVAFGNDRRLLVPLMILAAVLLALAVAWVALQGTVF